MRIQYSISIASMAIKLTSKSLLILLLDILPLCDELGIVLKLDQALEEEQVLKPCVLVATKRFRDESAQARVALIQPAARCNSICDVAKLLAAIEVDEVLEDRRLYELGMQFGDTVDLE